MSASATHTKKNTTKYPCNRGQHFHENQALFMPYYKKTAISDTTTTPKRGAHMHTPRRYSTLPIRIPTPDDTGCDPYILSICKERAAHVPEDFGLALQMLLCTVPSFPLCMGMDPIERFQPQTTSDIACILKAVHTLHSPEGQALRNSMSKPEPNTALLFGTYSSEIPRISSISQGSPKTAFRQIKQPERFIADYLKFGDSPFLNQTNDTLIATLQKKLPDTSEKSLRSLHQALRKIIPHEASYDYCNHRCLWLLDKLSKLDLAVGTITIESKKNGSERTTYLRNSCEEEWNYHIAPVVFSENKTYVFDMLTKELLLENNWIQIPWFSNQTENIYHIVNGYDATSDEIATATHALGRLYSRELEM